MKKLMIILGVSFTLFITGCGNNEEYIKYLEIKTEYKNKNLSSADTKFAEFKKQFPDSKKIEKLRKIEMEEKFLSLKNIDNLSNLIVAFSNFQKEFPDFKGKTQEITNKISDLKEAKLKKIAEEQKERERRKEEEKLDFIKGAEEYLIENLRDPNSYERISLDFNESRYSVTIKYRAKNGFGGYVVDSITFYFVEGKYGGGVKVISTSPGKN